MRLLVDAVGARFGGIATYAERLLAAWAQRFPDDELHVVVPAGATTWWPLPESAVRHEVTVRRPSTLGRPLAQTALLPRLAARVGADALLATLPSTTLRHPSVPLGVVVTDLRHELRPDQFSPMQRLLRRVSYGQGFRNADLVLCISDRSRDDLLRLHPRLPASRSRTVHLGADHVLSWPAPVRGEYAVAFGHHTNKNVDLVLAAWQMLGPACPPLKLLGIGAARRAELEADLRGRGIESTVTIAPFLDDAEFVTVMAGAGMVVFPTDFEGFGLPVVEAMMLGKPVVIAPEPACLEVAQGHAVVMAGWTPADLADAVVAAGAVGDSQIAAARRAAGRFSWAATAEQTRDAFCALTTGDVAARR